MIGWPSPTNSEKPAASSLSAADVCARVIGWLTEVARARWNQGALRPALRCIEEDANVQLFATRRLWRVPLLVNHAVVDWVNSGADVTVLPKAPSAAEMLGLQARGKRCVSLLDHVGSQEALDFALHDLCHLAKFRDPCHYVEQVGFFSLLEHALVTPAWQSLEHGFDEAWQKERDHVLADMNGSAVFLFVALKARLCRAIQRETDTNAPRLQSERFDLLYEAFLLSPELRAAARALWSRNDVASASLLRDYFTRWGEQVLAELP